MTKNITISLPKVRLLFPNLFEKQPVDGKFVRTEQDRRYTATFLLHKKEHAGTIESINNATEILMKELKIKKLTHPVMICCDEELDKIYDGDETGISKKNKIAYKAGHYQLQAKTVIPPVLRKVKGIKLNPSEDENPFYPGCYVNAVVELADYTNEFGKGISKYLKYVLFAKDGEKLLGASDIDGDSYFDDNEDEDENNDDFNDKDLF